MSTPIDAAAVHRMFEAVRAAQHQAEAALTVLVQQDHPEVEDVAYSNLWDCPEPGSKLVDPDTPNPLGHCVYDDVMDPCHDGCLYCGQPQERK